MESDMSITRRRIIKMLEAIGVALSATMAILAGIVLIEVIQHG